MVAESERGAAVSEVLLDGSPRPAEERHLSQNALTAYRSASAMLSGRKQRCFKSGHGVERICEQTRYQEPRPTPLPADQKPRQGVEHKGAGSPIVSAWRDMRLESRTCAAALTRGLQRTSQPISVNVSVFRTRVLRCHRSFKKLAAASHRIRIVARPATILTREWPPFLCEGRGFSCQLSN
jgi:hypothetical protein